MVDTNKEAIYRIPQSSLICLLLLNTINGSDAFYPNWKHFL